MPTDLIRQRYDRRTRGADGSLISPDTPRHGYSTSYVAFGCRCRDCRTWQQQYQIDRVSRIVHNREIIAALQPERDDLIAEAPVAVIEPHDGGNTVLPGESQLGALRRQGLPRPLVKPEEVDVVTLARRVAPDKVPPFTDVVRRRVTTVKALEDISSAYFEPEWTTRREDGRERRFGRGYEIVLSERDTIVWFAKRDLETAAQQRKTRGLPKAKGGRGGRKAVTRDGLLDSLRKAGCEVSLTGSGHYRAAKNGNAIVLPNTASDRRAYLNALSDAKKQGLL